ncbi:MAG: hypothetical protein Q7K36_05210, partial [Fusobacterium sp. JB020]|nr:hypothetical protein [Fusobacterium sp. JB020]
NNRKKEDNKNLTKGLVPEKETFLDKFENRIKEVEESGVNNLGQVEKEKIEEENLNKDISKVVALANQE